MTSEGEVRVYRALYLNKEGLHIRDISKHAGLTLPAVVKHVKKGEEKGAISCETKGRMKVCRLNFKSRHPLPLLQEVELSRFNGLPRVVQDAVSAFMDDLKENPLIALIFGSYAIGKQTKVSDVDVLLVYQRIDDKLMKQVEFSASKIKGRTDVNIQPVSLDYEEFHKEISNLENEFMKDVRKYGLVVSGMESYLRAIGRLYP